MTHEERVEQLRIARIKRWGTKTPEERFWTHVQKEGPVAPRLGTRCWIWTANSLNGYGRLKVNGEMVWAHRMSWQFAHGEVPAGMFVLHQCDNPPCVNPDHLFIGSKLDNARDRDAKCRRAAPIGVLNGRAKLTEDDVLKIRQRRSEGAKRKQLAQDFGVSLAAIKHVLGKSTWNHVGV